MKFMLLLLLCYTYKRKFYKFFVNIYNMDGQYNIYDGLYNTYQQSQQQKTSVKGITQEVLRNILEYIIKVGINIDPKYRYIRTGDGRYGIVGTDPKSFAFHMEIPDSLARAIGNIAKKYIPISGLDKLFSDILGGTDVTVIVGDKPDFYITKKTNQQFSQK